MFACSVFFYRSLLILYFVFHLYFALIAAYWRIKPDDSLEWYTRV